MKKRLILFLTAVVLASVCMIPGALASQVKYVYTRNSSPLNVRAWPDVNSSLLGKLPNGSTVNVDSYTSDYMWASIIYNGQVAYVMTQYLTDGNPYNPTPTPSGGKNYQSIVNNLESEFSTYRVVSPYTVIAKPVRASGWVNLRYAPSTDFGHAENLYANTQLTVIAETANWLQVRKNDDGVTGYVMRQYTISMGVGSSY